MCDTPKTLYLVSKCCVVTVQYILQYHDTLNSFAKEILCDCMSGRYIFVMQY